MRLSILKWKLKHCAKYIIVALSIVLFINGLILTIHFGEQRTKVTESIINALGSRNVREIVKPFTETNIIKGWNVPLPTDNIKGPFMTILVTSQAENVQRRNLIRRTWAVKKHNFDYYILFFTGKPQNGDLTSLKAEAGAHGDLIVDDMEESYFALTIKTLRMLKWFVFNSPHANFLVKVDDDVFVNTDNLILHLKSVQEQQQNHRFEKNFYFGGVVHTGRSPHTLNPYSKWYVPPEIWEPGSGGVNHSDMYSVIYSDHKGGYPPYCEGNFYVISGELVPVLLNASLSVRLFHLEDIYLSGLVASGSLKIKLQEIPQVYSASALWPTLNYYAVKLFQSVEDIIAYHCDNNIDLIQLLYDASIVK